MIKWINSSYAHGLLFGGNRVRKYQHVFSSVEFFVDENYGHTVSPECADLHQTTELWWVNLRMQLFVASIYDQMEEEFSNRLRQLYSRKYRVQQISAHICDRGEGIDG